MKRQKPKTETTGDGEILVLQGMTYHERESLKCTAWGDQATEVLIMIGHWMRQGERVPFSAYAANWAEAQTLRNVSLLRARWPLRGARRIADNCSDWDSYGRTGYPIAKAGGQVVAP